MALRNIAFFLACLAFAEHGHGVRSSIMPLQSSLAEIQQPTKAGPLRALAMVFLRFSPTAAFYPSSPKAPSSTVHSVLSNAPVIRCAVPSMCDESDEEAKRAKEKQLEAERAALKAEKAALELAALEVEAARLKQLRAEDEAAEPEVLSPLESLRVPGAKWSEPPGKFHRFVKEGDPTFEKYINVGFGLNCKTPDKFIGTTKQGVSDGTFRVQFTLPTGQAKTIEILQTSNNNPSFGAVKVKVPFTCDVQRISSDVDPTNTRLVARRPSEDIQSRTSIRDGDFIRAASLPYMTSSAEEEAPEEAPEKAPFWRRFTRIESRKMPDAEEGMVILDGKTFADFYRVLEENVKVNEKEAEVVLIIERPGGGNA